MTRRRIGRAPKLGHALSHDLLDRAQPGKNDLTALRAAPCQVLNPRELSTPDHVTARKHMQTFLRRVQESLQSTGLQAPLKESVAEDGRDWEHLGLRLAHAAFGIAASLKLTMQRRGWLG